MWYDELLLAFTATLICGGGVVLVAMPLDIQNNVKLFGRFALVFAVFAGLVAGMCVSTGWVRRFLAATLGLLWGFICFCPPELCPTEKTMFALASLAAILMVLYVWELSLRDEDGIAGDTYQAYVSSTRLPCPSNEQDYKQLSAAGIRLIVPVQAKPNQAVHPVFLANTIVEADLKSDIYLFCVHRVQLKPYIPAGDLSFSTPGELEEEHVLVDKKQAGRVIARITWTGKTDFTDVQTRISLETVPLWLNLDCVENSLIYAQTLVLRPPPQDLEKYVKLLNAYLKDRKWQSREKLEWQYFHLNALREKNPSFPAAPLPSSTDVMQRYTLPVPNDLFLETDPTTRARTSFSDKKQKPRGHVAMTRQ